MRWTVFAKDRLTGWWTLLCLLLVVAYTLVFWLDLGTISRGTINSALVNAGSLWVLGIGFGQLLLRSLSPNLQPGLRLALSCLAVGLLSLLWYGLIGALFGWLRAGNGLEAVIQQFSGPAFRWQMLQGLLAGAALLFLIDAARQRERLAEAERALASQSESASVQKNLLLRDGDELVRVTLDEIGRIEADGNEVAIIVGPRTIRVRKPLRELEAELPNHFIRIHRGMLVNIDRIERMEPAGGGRLTVHMADGSAPIASRSGAAALKERAI